MFFRFRSRIEWRLRRKYSTQTAGQNWGDDGRPGGAGDAQIQLR
jgi:hypothetical protein